MLTSYIIFNNIILFGTIKDVPTLYYLNGKQFGEWSI